MKSENSNLLLGLGLGALVGVAIGCYMTAERRKKLADQLHETGHEIKDGVKNIYSKARAKAEEAGADMADRTGEWAERAGEKAREWGEKAGDKAAGIADDLSQKANDLRRRNDNKQEMSGNPAAQPQG